MSKEEFAEKIKVLQEQVPTYGRTCMERGFDIAIALLAQDANASVESIRKSNNIAADVLARFQVKTTDEFHTREAYLKGLQTRVMELYDAQRGANDNGNPEEKEIGEKPNEN